jgi:hypothetical protein
MSHDSLAAELSEPAKRQALELVHLPRRGNLLY